MVFVKQSNTLSSADGPGRPDNDTFIKTAYREVHYVRYRIMTKNGNIKYVRDYGHLVYVESDVDQFYVFIVEE